MLWRIYLHLQVLENMSHVAENIFEFAKKYESRCGLYVCICLELSMAHVVENMSAVARKYNSCCGE
jgi:hypothetical protein